VKIDEVRIDRRGRDFRCDGYRAYLEDAGYRVVAIAADQDEAISAAENAEVAFVDLNLRDGPTGPSIARDLAARFGIRVIYVTANPSQIGEPAPNAIGFIRKPFTDDAILAAIGMATDIDPNTSRNEAIIAL